MRRYRDEGARFNPAYDRWYGMDRGRDRYRADYYWDHNERVYPDERMEREPQPWNRSRSRMEMNSRLPVPYTPHPYMFGPEGPVQYHDYGGQDHGYYDAYGRGVGVGRYTRYRLPERRRMS